MAEQGAGGIVQSGDWAAMSETNSPPCGMVKAVLELLQPPRQQRKSSAVGKRSLVLSARQSAPWRREQAPRLFYWGHSFRERWDGNLGNQEKLGYKDEERLNDSTPTGDFSRDQKLIELSGRSSSSV